MAMTRILSRRNTSAFLTIISCVASAQEPYEYISDFFFRNFPRYEV
jgi:hypothetical protein